MKYNLKMKNNVYESDNLKDLRDLIQLYKNKYLKLSAFEYKLKPTDKELIVKTFEEFVTDIEDFGAYMLKNNFKRVAIISPNRYEWCVSYLAATTSNIEVVPLDKSLPLNEVSDLLERSEADTIIYAKQYHEAITSCQNKICFDEKFEDSLLYSEELDKSRKLDHTEYNNIKIDNEKMSVMIFTSGTTSISKAVMLSQKSICTVINDTKRMFYVPKGSRFLSFLPLHHVFESVITFLFGSSLVVTLIFCDGLKYFASNIKDYNITGFVCVPLVIEMIYKRIIKELEKKKKLKLVNFLRKIFRHTSIKTRRKVFKQIFDNIGPNLQSIIAGGAALDKDTAQGLYDFGFDVYQGYGLTETSGAIAAENKYVKKPGSVGFPFSSSEIKIFEPDKTGEGEIIIRGDAVMLGYYKNEEATKSAIIDGWFHTGDLGKMDKKGILSVTGRKKDVIVFKNGKKVFPEELEKLINDIQYINESMVFGHIENTKLNRNSDIVLFAEIVILPENKEKYFPNKTDEEIFEQVNEDIKNLVNRKIPAYKYIRKIIISNEELIKTTTRKIKRNKELEKIKEKLEV